MVTETFAEYGTEPLIERLRRSTIGRYDVYAELGSGGMASVFLALDLALDRKVAIKVMSPALASSADAIERFRREAKVAAALNHPNIIGIYAVGDDPELAYYVMKFIEGRSLDSVIRDEGKQSIQFTQAIIQYSGNALAYAHTRGVVHRDVKPANFMLDLDGWLVVTDFGIAKMEDAKGLTMSGTLVGTPYYMSPEQFDGSPVTGAVDQYALGVVAYEMLTGRTPFNATSLGEVMKGHLLDPPPPIRELRADVPLEMEACIQRMLAKKPSDRFPSLAEAVNAFGSIHPVDERQIRTQIISLAKSGALLQPRMSVPASPMPTRNPARPSRSQRQRGSAAPQSSVSSVPSTKTKVIAAVLILGVATAGLYFARPDLFTRVESPSAMFTELPSASAAGTSVSEASLPAAPAPTESAPAESSRDSIPAVTSTPPRQQPAASSTPRQESPRSTTTPPPAVATPPAASAPEAGSLVIQSNLDGVGLYIDGALREVIGGRGRQSISLPPGEYRISLRLDGCTPFEQVVVVRAGEETRIGNRFPTCE